MKDQYFGDINDYRKYGLLRALTEASGLRLGVCWLLTAPDGRTDGEFRSYLEAPDRWRDHDPELFDALERLCEEGVGRSVHHAEAWGLLPGARYFTDLLEDRAGARNAYFDRAWAALADCPLLFMDPDNGIEVTSKPRGSRDSAKYLYWSEVEEAYRRGHSLVIYQHWPRKPRAEYTRQLAQAFRERLGAPLVDSFATPHVLFMLVAQPSHVGGFVRAHELILDRWEGQIMPMAHVEAAPGDQHDDLKEHDRS